MSIKSNHKKGTHRAESSVNELQQQARLAHASIANDYHLLKNHDISFAYIRRSREGRNGELPIFFEHSLNRT